MSLINRDRKLEHIKSADTMWNGKTFHISKNESKNELSGFIPSNYFYFITSVGYTKTKQRILLGDSGEGTLNLKSRRNKNLKNLSPLFRNLVKALNNRIDLYESHLLS